MRARAASDAGAGGGAAESRLCLILDFRFWIFDLKPSHRKLDSNLEVLRQQMKSVGLLIKFCDQVLHLERLRRFFQPSDFFGTYSGFAAFQLNQAHLHVVGILLSKSISDRINDAGARSAGRTFKESHAPAVGLAVVPQCLLARCLRGMGFLPCRPLSACRPSLQSTLGSGHDWL